MRKTDPTVIKETKYILCWVLVLSALLQAVFLIIGRWDYTVLTGNALSGGVAVLNFFLMGRTVQSAVDKDEKDAKTAMKVSQTYRFLLVLVAVAVGVGLPYFHSLAVLIPVFFPRLAIAVRPLFDKTMS